MDLNSQYPVIWHRAWNHSNFLHSSTGLFIDDCWLIICECVLSYICYDSQYMGLHTPRGLTDGYWWGGVCWNPKSCNHKNVHGMESHKCMHTIIIAILLYFWLNSAVMSLYVTSLLSAPVNKHNLDVTNYSEGIFQLV